MVVRYLFSHGHIIFFGVGSVSPALWICDPFVERFLTLSKILSVPQVFEQGPFLSLWNLEQIVYGELRPPRLPLFIGQSASPDYFPHTKNAAHVLMFERYISRVSRSIRYHHFSITKKKPPPPRWTPSPPPPPSSSWQPPPPVNEKRFEKTDNFPKLRWLFSVHHVDALEPCSTRKAFVGTNVQSFGGVDNVGECAHQWWEKKRKSCVSCCCCWGRGGSSLLVHTVYCTLAS